MKATLKTLRRFPLRGLAGEEIERTRVSPLSGLPFDRLSVLTTTSVGPEGEVSSYLGIMEEPKLGLLQPHYDEASGILSIERDGKTLTRGKVLDPLGQTLISQFFAAYLKGSPRGMPKLVARADGFHDTTPPWISLINLASVTDIERVARQKVDARRFRGNLMIEGLAPWEEMGWIGRRLQIGGASFEVVEKTVRCAVTMINPDTQEKDLNVPRLLQVSFGHTVCGVYLKILAGGDLATGEELQLLSD